MVVDDGRFGDENVDFGAKFGFRLGVQFELELYNINNWALLFEPTLQQFKADEVVQDTDVFIDYYSVELAFGVRYYFLNMQNSRLFVNGNFIYDVPIKTDFNVDVIQRTPATNLKESLGFNAGLGYQLNKKISLELQYNGTRNIINEFLKFSSEYQGVSLIFGYTFF